MQRAVSGELSLTQDLLDVSAWQALSDQLIQHPYPLIDPSVASFPCPSPTASPLFPPATPLSRLFSLERATSAIPGAIPDASPLCPPVLAKTKTQEFLGSVHHYNTTDMLFPLPSPLPALEEFSQDSDISVGSLTSSQPSDDMTVTSPHSSFDQCSYLDSWGPDSYDDSSSVDASLAPPTPQLTHHDSVETVVPCSGSECDFSIDGQSDGQSDASPADCDPLPPSPVEDDEVQFLPTPTTPLTEDSPLCDVYKAVLAAHPHEGRYGLYSRAERKAKLQYYREKRARARASYGKKVQYQCRFSFAVERPRVGGRFTKKTEGDWSEADKLSLQRRLQAQEERTSKPKSRLGRPKSSAVKKEPAPSPAPAPAAAPAPMAVKPAFFLLATTL